MEELLNYIRNWANEYQDPVNDIIFRCFLYIQENAGVLSRYEMLIATEGATHQARQNVNRRIARAIESHLDLRSAGRRYLPKGKYLINSYTILN